MLRLRIILIQIALWSVGALFAQNMPYKKEVKDGKEFYVYQVESGEGLFAVCRKFSVTQEEILKYNAEAEDGLRNGQTLRIPIKKNTIKIEDTSYFYHTIDQGETIQSIALMYGVSTNAIRRLNPDADKKMKVGLTLKIPQTVHEKETVSVENYQYHTIAPRETLYALATKYGLSTQDILNANPGLSASTFQVGKVVRIDVSRAKKAESTKSADPENNDEYVKYTIHNNESVFSISRKFSISPDSLLLLNPNLKNGLRTGLIIRVPAPKVTGKEPEAESDVTDTKQTKNDDSTSAVTISQQLKVAVLLPFMVDESGEEASKQSRRFIEYYEGLLMAIDKLKDEGISIDLQVYDTGSESKSISKILRQPELANVQLIIGPVFNEHIALVSKFAKEKNIELVIPFTSKNDEVLTNPNIIQVNTPHSYLYSAAAQLFCKKFKNQLIVFVEEANKPADKADFIAVLKAEMKRRLMVFKTFVAKNDDDFENITGYLAMNQENVIVPVSGGFNELKQIVPSLQSVATNNPTLKISLFGYPEWQTYMKDYLDAFHSLNTYIYSTFFVNPTASDYKDFSANFHSWFQREIINSYPKYGVLGYDTGLYFLRTMTTIGNNFDRNISKKSYHGIQTGFSFDRVNNWGGLINKNVYLVNYGRNFEINKLISDK